MVILSDIQGLEDFLGDMDFKVCGTEKGITALQMDNKAKGLSVDILARALKQAREGPSVHPGRHARDHRRAARAAARHRARASRPSTSPWTRSATSSGTGGKVVRGIQEETGASIDIQEDGTIHIAATGRPCRRGRQGHDPGHRERARGGRGVRRRGRGHQGLRRVREAHARQGRPAPHLPRGQRPRGQGGGRAGLGRRREGEGARGATRTRARSRSTAWTSRTPPKGPRLPAASAPTARAATTTTTVRAAAAAAATETAAATPAAPRAAATKARNRHGGPRKRPSVFRKAFEKPPAASRPVRAAAPSEPSEFVSLRPMAGKTRADAHSRRPRDAPSPCPSPCRLAVSPMPLRQRLGGGAGLRGRMIGKTDRKEGSHDQGGGCGMRGAHGHGGRPTRCARRRTWSWPAASTRRAKGGDVARVRLRGRGACRRGLRRARGLHAARRGGGQPALRPCRPAWTAWWAPRAFPTRPWTSWRRSRPRAHACSTHPTSRRAPCS